MNAPLRIGLLATGFASRGAGMNRFARELLAALGRRNDLELVVVLPRGTLAEFEAMDIPNVIEVHEEPGRTAIDSALWIRHRAGRYLEMRGVHVVHGTKHLVPRTPLPTVLTVHDVMAITSREQFVLPKRLLLPGAYMASLRAASLLVAVSKATAERLASLDPSFQRKTVIAPEGIATELRSGVPQRPTNVPDQQFALVVGDLSPRKNIVFLTGIWKRVSAATGGLQLVSVGPDGWRGGPTRKHLEELQREGLAIRAGRVSDAELRWYYEHASVVLLPSLEEGFGLPMIEALSFGLQVVASTDDALMEASQGRAVHISTSEPDAWVRAIAAAARREVSVEPLTHIATWDEHAAIIVEAYRRAVAE